MTTYLALLRGINVGGRRVKMERLRELFRELGLANVRTYIQSGNVFFEVEEPDLSALTTRIEVHLRAALGYEVPVFLRTLPALEGVLDPNPFAQVTVVPETRLLIVFTSAPLTCSQPLPLCSLDNAIEILQVTPNEVFITYRVVDGRLPDVSGFLRRTFGKSANATTTRFYGTTLKMWEFGKGRAA